MKIKDIEVGTKIYNLKVAGTPHWSKYRPGIILDTATRWQHPIMDGKRVPGYTSEKQMDRAGVMRKGSRLAAAYLTESGVWEPCIVSFAAIHEFTELAGMRFAEQIKKHLKQQEQREERKLLEERALAKLAELGVERTMLIGDEEFDIHFEYSRGNDLSYLIVKIPLAVLEVMAK